MAVAKLMLRTVIGAILASATLLAGSGTTADPPRLDGLLDEAAWGQPELTAELIQQSPRPGAPTVFTTTVRVIVTERAVVLGFECRDPEPARIAIHTMQRDSEMEGDDTVALVLDTYGDKRTGYFFQVNAAGARADGLISNPEHISYDWDGIWDARTARTPSGWSAEIELPVRTLSFAPGLKSWGLNLQRFVAREQVTLRWQSPNLDAFLYDMKRAGALPGVEGLQQGRGIEVTPYLTGRMRGDFEEPHRTWQSTAGLDTTWRITPKLATVLTVNTDFAETEVDARQINITRFPLFFPEKRAFFLEGSNQFEFGLGLGETFIPFFTRRVGLFGGEQIPINAGLKLNGRVGQWNVGLLDVQTRDTPMAPGTNLFASRVSVDLNENLRVGTIVTNGNPDGRMNNTLGGIDAVWQTSRFRGDKNFMIGGWTAFSHDDLEPGQNGGWGFKVDYPNDLWDCAATFNQFGDALRPALGFLPRPGVRRYTSKCDYMPRPSRTGRLRSIRQAFFSGSASVVTDLKGTTESWAVETSPLGLIFETGDKVEVDWEPQYEFLREPFDISEGIAINPGAYRFNRFQIGGETSEHRALRFETDVSFGGFYSGNLTQWEHSLSWTSSSGRAQFGLGVEQNFGRLPEGNFVQRLWQLRTALSWTPNLTLTSFVQWDDESGDLGTNTRVQWTLKPGREIFLVWNRGWRRLITSRDDLILGPESEIIAVKIRWTLWM